MRSSEEKSCGNALPSDLQYIPRKTKFMYPYVHMYIFVRTTQLFQTSSGEPLGFFLIQDSAALCGKKNSDFVQGVKWLMWLLTPKSSCQVNAKFCNILDFKFFLTIKTGNLKVEMSNLCRPCFICINIKVAVFYTQLETALRENALVCYSRKCRPAVVDIKSISFVNGRHDVL